MENEPVGLQQFAAGWSVDQKYGSRNQFYYSRHIDFRKKPGQFTVLPTPSPLAATGVVTDLVIAMEQTLSGTRYAVGDTGKVYKVATDGTWSNPGTIGENSGAGLSYRADSDHLYITGQTKVSRIKDVGGAATFEADWFVGGRSNNQKSATAYKTGGGQTYTVPTSITENAANMRTFTTDIEPITKIGVKVVSKGTGNWTLTLHDDANTVLGTATVANGSLTNGAINYFTFSSAVRAFVQPNARTYHFHLTSTVGDGTVQTGTNATLADSDLEVHASALIATTNGLHPTLNFLQYTLIGNGRYVAAYEPLQNNPDTSDFERHRVTLPTGYEVCGFAQRNQFAVIGAEKRSTSGEYQEGALFFWDGISPTYNDWWLVPEGSPEALFNSQNTVTYIAGGSLYRMNGMESPTKVRTFRNTDSEYSAATDSTHVYPNTMTIRRGILLMAYPSHTTNTSLEHGIYSLGSVAREYPESFGFNYTASHGDLKNTGSKNLRIGMVKNFGDTLYSSWRNDSKSPAYGVDIITNSSAPSPDFTLESLYFDNQLPFKAKRAGKIICTFNPLPTGASIAIKYKIDGAATWTYPPMTSQSTYVIADVQKEFYGIEFGIDGVSGAISPAIKSLYLFFDPQKNERELGE